MPNPDGTPTAAELEAKRQFEQQQQTGGMANLQQRILDNPLAFAGMDINQVFKATPGTVQTTPQQVQPNLQSDTATNQPVTVQPQGGTLQSGPVQEAAPQIGGGGLNVSSTPAQSLTIAPTGGTPVEVTPEQLAEKARFEAGQEAGGQQEVARRALDIKPSPDLNLGKTPPAGTTTGPDVSATDANITEFGRIATPGLEAASADILRRLGEDDAGITQRQRDLALDLAARQEGTQAQALQDVLGKAGLAGTARGIREQAGLLGEQAQRRADIAREAEIGGIEEARLQREKAVEQALGLGRLGLGREGIESEERQTAARIESGETVAFAQMDSNERIATLRASTDTEIANIYSENRIDVANLNNASAETIAAANNRSREFIEGYRNQIANRGLDLEETKLLGYDPVDENGNPIIDPATGQPLHIPGTLEIEGKRLGLQGDTLELQTIEILGGTLNDDGTITPTIGADGQPIKGKLQIESEKLAEAVKAGDRKDKNDRLERIYSLAAVLPPEQGAKLLADTLTTINADLPPDQQIRINKPIDDPLTAADILSRATAQAGEGATEEQILDIAKNLADDEGFVWVGSDGINPAAPGETRTNPKFIGLEDMSNTRRLGRDFASFLSTDDTQWREILDGEYIEFPENMSSDLGFTLPAGTYRKDKVQSGANFVDVYIAADGTKYLASNKAYDAQGNETHTFDTTGISIVE